MTVTELTGADGFNLGLSQEESAGDVTFQLSGADENTPPTVNQISDFVDSVLGGVNNLEPKAVSTGTEGAGKIVRSLPRVHSWRPEMSAAALVSLTAATERHTPENAVGVFGLDSMTSQWPNAHAYKARFRFIKRPYFLLPDSKIELERRSYFDPAGTEKPVYVAQEWRRFTKVNRKPLPDTASASAGQMTLRTQSGGAPNTVQSTSAVTLFLQNQQIEVDWFNVPYRYLLDVGAQRSYLTRFVGTVNQNEVMGFPAGSLLYQGCEVTNQYIPITPKRQKLLKALAVGLDQSLLCNLRLRFLFTARQGTDVPNSGHALLTNRNNVAAGHNLFPHYETRRFYYSASGVAATPDANRKPAFESFEFGLFFTDPMLTQAAGPI